MVLLKPELAVGKQEVDDLVLSVVEAEAIPSWMLATVALIEILAGVAGKVAKSLVLVLYSMAVDNVHDDGNTQFMSAVNERL